MSYVLSAVREEVEKNHQSWLQEGEQRKALSIAKNLLEQNVPLSVIKSATGLSDQELALEEES